MLVHWPLWSQRRNFVLLTGAFGLGVTSYKCSNRIPGGHAGLVKPSRGLMAVYWWAESE